VGAGAGIPLANVNTGSQDSWVVPKARGEEYSYSDGSEVTFDNDNMPKLIGATDGWKTLNLEVNTGDLSGTLPVFVLMVRTYPNSEVHVKSVTIVEHIHEWVADPENDKAPTCVEPGKIAYKCQCGDAKFEEGAPVVDHDYSVNGGLTCAGCKNSKTPAAPTVAAVSFNSVTLNAVAGLEYSIDGENWQTSEIFAELTAETQYTFYCRVAASDIANVSEKSEALVVTTEAAPDFIPGDVDGNGIVDVGDLAILKKAVAGLIGLDDPSVVNPDVDNNGDSMPDVVDLALLKKIIAHLV
jgi:hypothetical protein